MHDAYPCILPSVAVADSNEADGAASNLEQEGSPNEESSSTSDDATVDLAAAEALQDGWHTIDGKTYYYVAGQTTKGAANIDEKWYYFDTSDSHMLTGSQFINGYWYRYDLNTGEMLFGSQFIDGKWYRYDPYCGYMLFGSQNVDFKWYRYDPYCGYMLFGSQYIDGHWYRYDLNCGNMLFGPQFIDYVPKVGVKENF